jgi:DNA polymerase-3 subunit chi
VTEVAFHFNTPGKIGYACRLVRKAAATGARVVVTGDAATLRELDVALWTYSPLEFVAHCNVEGAAPQVLAASPVVLATDSRMAPHQEVLVNLGSPVPDGFERFDRLIEVVTTDDVDRLQARQRWKHYADRGYDMKRHDLARQEER